MLDNSLLLFHGETLIHIVIVSIVQKDTPQKKIKYDTILI